MPSQKLKERAKEAIQFFQNENEEEPEMNDVFEEDVEKRTENENTVKDDIASEKIETESGEEKNFFKQTIEPGESSSKDTNNVQSEDIFEKQTEELFSLQSDKEIAEFQTISLENNAGVDNPEFLVVKENEPAEMPSTVPKNQIELHTEKNELDFELDNLILKSKAGVSDIDTINRPRLHGSEGMFIDLETNEVKPKEKSGAEELLERFMKTTRKKTESELEEIGIFNTETGVLEKQKIHHVATERQAKEPKPGEAYFKLKSELSKKISEKRREIITNRIKDEQQKRRELESDDEDMEEYSDCGAEENVEDEEEIIEEDLDNVDETDSNAAPRNEFLDDEADEDEQQNDVDNEESEENIDADENDAESNDSDSKSEKPTKRSRIISAFEDDSDEEKPIETIPNEKKITILSDVVIKEPLFNIPAPVDTHNQSPSLDTSLNKSNGDLDVSINTQKTFGSDEMQEFESRLFQVNTPTESLTENPLTSKNVSTSNLFSQSNDVGELGESQLMALCSGEFVTQNPNASVPEQNSTKVDQMVSEDEKKYESLDINEEVVQSTEVQAAAVQSNYIAGRMTLLSSDDEESTEGTETRVKKLKKKKERQKLTFSGMVLVDFSSYICLNEKFL